MADAPLPLHEAERLAVLREFAILDSAPEQAYDDVVLLASTICAVPIALITFVDEERQWFKARVGLEAQSTPREHAFCAHALVHAEPLIVPDALMDARFADNPLVTGAPGIRFYAGSPLATPSGHNLGTLCVIDTVPRVLTSEQLGALQALSRVVVEQLALRRTSAGLAAALTRVRTLSGLLPICAYCKRVRDDRNYWLEVEAYIRAHAPVEFSHGVCPRCIVEHFPDFAKD